MSELKSKRKIRTANEPEAQAEKPANAGLSPREILHQIQKGVISSNAIRKHLTGLNGFETLTAERPEVNSEAEIDWIIRITDQLKRSL